MIYVHFISRDFPHFWPGAFSDLFALLHLNGVSDQYKVKLIRKYFNQLIDFFLDFIISMLETLNSEIVERGENKSTYELDLANRVKDGIREIAIQDILQVLSLILQD